MFSLTRDTQQGIDAGRFWFCACQGRWCQGLCSWSASILHWVMPNCHKTVNSNHVSLAPQKLSSTMCINNLICPIFPASPLFFHMLTWMMKRQHNTEAKCWITTLNSATATNTHTYAHTHTLLPFLFLNFAMWEDKIQDTHTHHHHIHTHMHS